MQRILTAMALLAPMALAGAAPGVAEYSADPQQSRLEFSGVQAGAEFKGTFHKFTAAVQFSPDGSQLSDRRAVSAHNDRSSGLHLTEYCGGLIAKLSLSDGTDFHKTNCSTL